MPTGNQTNEVRLEPSEFSPGENAIKGGENEIRSSNHILKSIPIDIWQKWQPHMRRVLIHQDQILIERRTAPEYVYFVERGLVSLVTCLTSGVQAEIAVIGSEGMVGAQPYAFHSSHYRAVVQVPGKALRLPIQHFQSEFKMHGVLQNLSWRYNNLLMAQAAQTAACNRSHSLKERLCRWLLTMRDQTGSNELEMTHLAIANLLGSRRSGVTVALGELQQAQILDVTRSLITIADADLLVTQACECYCALREEFADWESASGEAK